MSTQGWAHPSNLLMFPHTIQRELVNNRNGNSRRRLRFLSDSIRPNRHRSPAEGECRLSNRAVRTLTGSLPDLWGVSCLSFPGWGAAVFPGRKTRSHTSLPRYYEDSYRQLQKPSGRRRAARYRSLRKRSSAGLTRNGERRLSEPGNSSIDAKVWTWFLDVIVVVTTKYREIF